MFDFGALRDLDWLLVLAMVLIVAIGVVVILSASYDRANPHNPGVAGKQMLWFGLGLPLFFGAACFEYRKLRVLAVPIYVATILVLLYVVFFGVEQKGAQRWIDVGPIELQPSEFAKLTIIFMLAYFLSEYRKMSQSFWYVLIPLAIAGVPVLLIFMQPDLGTSLTLIPVLFGMLFIAKARPRYLLIVILAGMSLVPMLWLNMKPYQLRRVLEFASPRQRQIAAKFMRESQREGLREKLDPSGELTLNEALDKMGTGWNSEQSLIAVGSGGFYGRGWRSGSQTQLDYLPSAHTDFVFAVLCEEWGFLGSLAVVALFFLLVNVATRIACEAQDSFGRLLAMGIVILIISHIVINMGMTIGLMPITGLPLPLLSYGGSSIWMTMISLGLLESIHSRRHYFKSGRYSQ